MNVLHDELMMPKVCKRYDVGCVVYNANPQILNFLEPWCDTIYVDLPQQIVANYISEEQKISHFDIDKKAWKMVFVFPEYLPNGKNIFFLNLVLI